MKNILNASILFCCVIASGLIYATQTLETVPYVDVERYLGKWYEIARLPQIYQPGCTAVTAEYTLNPDGSIGVFNFCRIIDPKYGLPISIKGKAVPIDETNSKLNVTFFGGLTKGKYWVLELDPDYQWVMVGDPQRITLYILARSPVLDDEIYQDLLELAVDRHGYNIEKIIKTRHRSE